MGSKRRKPRDNQLADRYRNGDFDPERVFEKDDIQSEQYSNRTKHAEQNKIVATQAMRAGVAASAPVNPAVRAGAVTLVYSLYCDVTGDDGIFYLCTTRKTLNKLTAGGIVVGDRIEFLPTGNVDESGRTEGVVERVLPRSTILTRADSFKGRTQQPIVANADQMLIVASVRHPAVKWGLVDRMIVAARSGGLVPIVNLNKVDLLAVEGEETPEVDADEALDHYLSLGIQTLRSSVDHNVGIDELRDLLTGKVTVLAGHSGVGKSSLIRAVQPSIDIRVGEVSEFTAKGRHTTTSARHYPLDGGGAVVDTPGVKMFGLWKITADSLEQYFPDVEAGTAPAWRQESYERIAATLGG
jgi:ribosome biogenesis GTPase